MVLQIRRIGWCFNARPTVGIVTNEAATQHIEQLLKIAKRVRTRQARIRAASQRSIEFPHLFPPTFSPGNHNRRRRLFKPGKQLEHPGTRLLIGPALAGHAKRKPQINHRDVNGIALDEFRCLMPRAGTK